MITSNFAAFLDEIYSRLRLLGIDTDSLSLDHIGYLAADAADFDQQIAMLEGKARKHSVKIVGGIRVAIYSLPTPLKYNSQVFTEVEVVEPKAGKNVKSGLEHAEFLTGISLEEFMSKYPDLEWDTTAMYCEQFPMLTIALGDGFRAKFPRRSVLEELERQREAKQPS